jgi:hypothetical protein
VENIFGPMRFRLIQVSLYNVLPHVNKISAEIKFQLRRNKEVVNTMWAPLGLLALLCSLSGTGIYRTPTSSHLPQPLGPRISNLPSSYFALAVIIQFFSFIVSSDYVREDKPCKSPCPSLHLVTDLIEGLTVVQVSQKP